MKQYKISTLRHLKQIIAEAKLLVDNVENIHEENGYMFAHLSSELLIDDKLVYIRISIKKKLTVNWFWIHNIDETKKSPKLLDPSDKMELKEI